MTKLTDGRRIPTVKTVRRFIGLLLVFAAATAGAGAAVPTFPDITDPATAENVAVLQMLGVVEGDGGLFKPSGTLTRAEFCKMAVVVIGRQKEEPLYRNRTIFPDVRANHWARGYIGLAVTGENKLISGFTDGLFRPDDDITFAQSVTLLMRILGYTDADAGFLWPSGYLELAARAGLTDGSGGEPGSAISRAWAAGLFRNLLTCDTKDGAPFAGSFGKLTDDVIIMDLDAVTEDNKTGAVKTSAGVLVPRGGVPEAFLGKRGTLVTDDDGRMVAFLPEGGDSATIIASSVGATWVKDAAGRRHEIPGDTPVYTAGDTVTFTDIFVDIAPGTALTVFYSPGGSPDAVYMNNRPADEALVVSSASVSFNTFSAITGGSAGGYPIYKNGTEAAIGDIAQYDVATFDPVSRVLRVSDLRITGYYENAWPNTDSPSRVTVFGHEFDVLPSAGQALSRFGLGQVITLLFTADLTVAGAVSRTEAQGTAIGIVGDGATGASATVTLLDGTEFSGNPGISDYSASQLRGELVNVVSAGVGKITLIKISARQGLKGEIDLAERTLGNLKLSKSVRVFERVGKGAVARISPEDISLPDGAKIPAYKVAYAGTDNLGRVDTLILDDVTGDRYIYGFLSEKFVPAPTLGGEDEATNRCVIAENSSGKIGPALAGGLEFTNGALGGLALSGDGERAAAIAPLTEHKNVLRSDFTVIDGKATVKLGETVVPVSGDVQCYNRASKSWFSSLADARAFSETLTVYCDRTPETGGKARVIVAG
jgi:hypothetical protein